MYMYIYVSLSEISWVHHSSLCTLHASYTSVGLACDVKKRLAAASCMVHGKLNFVC